MSHRSFWTCMWSLICLLASADAYGQEQSFRSANGFFIRHQNLVGFITDIDNSDGLGRSDATFNVVPGLAGQCHSLAAVKPAGFYLRHQDFRIVLAQFEDSTLFRQDATFCMMSPGLTGGAGTVSFQSVNFQNFYIRHFNFQLFLNQTDNSAQFNSDATFDRIQPLTQVAPHLSL